MIQPSQIADFHDDSPKNSFHKILNLPRDPAILTSIVTTTEVDAHKLTGR
jgi:hypothetical protein